jgi:biopolymer transport protein ExbD
MKKPQKPKRKPASKKPTMVIKDAQGKVKYDDNGKPRKRSLEAYEKALTAWVEKEKQKDVEHQKNLTQYEKDQKEYEAKLAKVSNLAGYTPNHTGKAKGKK